MYWSCPGRALAKMEALGKMEGPGGLGTLTKAASILGPLPTKAPLESRALQNLLALSSGVYDRTHFLFRVRDMPIFVHLPRPLPVPPRRKPH